MDQNTWSWNPWLIPPPPPPPKLRFPLPFSSPQGEGNQSPSPYHNKPAHPQPIADRDPRLNPRNFYNTNYQHLSPIYGHPFCVSPSPPLQLPCLPPPPPPPPLQQTKLKKPEKFDSEVSHESLSDQIQELKLKLEAKDQEISMLKSSASNSQCLTEKIYSRNSKIKELEKNVYLLENKIKELRQRLKSKNISKSSLQHLQTQLDEKQTKIKELKLKEANLGAIKLENENLKGELAGKKKIIETHTHKEQRLEAENQRLKLKNKTCVKDTLKLKDKYKRLRVAEREAQMDINSRKSETKYYEHEVQRIQSQLERLKEDLTAKVTTLREKLEEDMLVTVCDEDGNVLTKEAGTVVFEIVQEQLDDLLESLEAGINVEEKELPNFDDNGFEEAHIEISTPNSDSERDLDRSIQQLKQEKSDQTDNSY